MKLKLMTLALVISVVAHADTAPVIKLRSAMGYAGPVTNNFGYCDDLTDRFHAENGFDEASAQAKQNALLDCAQNEKIVEAVTLQNLGVGSIPGQRHFVCEVRFWYRCR